MMKRRSLQASLRHLHSTAAWSFEVIEALVDSLAVEPITKFAVPTAERWATVPPRIKSCCFQMSGAGNFVTQFHRELHRSVKSDNLLFVGECEECHDSVAHLNEIG